ncbi:MAG TPA: acetoacetate--CoA ligase [Ilumatobacteraceae bacterium]|nr:acetoacetate--CoA ligase [Ilumatobacteraceae bacterium]
MSDEQLWAPTTESIAHSNIGQFVEWLAERGSGPFQTYDELWRWSVDDLESFWSAIAGYFGVEVAGRILESSAMPDARWLTGTTLNYAAHALRHASAGPAIVGHSQTRPVVRMSHTELSEHVARARAGLQRLGVQRGDRVAAYLPNVPETIVAFLATASLGAIWTSCAPEFGVRAVLDRFGQIDPKVLFVIDGYQYGSRAIDRRAEVQSIRDGLPSLEATVALAYLDDEIIPTAISWDDFVGNTGPLEFAHVPADHPLYVLYSSGTTGMPKPIVHGHGGVLLEHLKVLGLHNDMRESDRFFWFTTTGWMMWNYVVSGLLVGATLVTFDGDPASPSLDALWSLAEQEQITWFGSSAPYFMACRKAGLQPGRDHDLSRLRAIGSTGAPLPAEGFHWIYDEVKSDVMLSSISGGTDVCSAFVGGCPMVPVVAGKISCRYLGAAVEAFDDSGKSVIGEQGELVITKPMPSMPVGFWGDEDGSRLRAAYFDTYPGVWRHGDWITIDDDGSCVITGRSDATLNRGGVRIGTSEIYRVVETIAGISDSLIVHLEDMGGGGGVLVLFVVLDAGVGLDDVLGPIKQSLRTNLSPRHVPDEIHSLPSVPTTLSGKKLELPVKKILRGADPDAVASRGALKNPESLDSVAEIARSR